MAKESVELVRNFSRPRRIGILDLLKRQEALSVGEISKQLGMSYMGVKQHCSALEKAGYLTTWRRPRQGAVGRPELVYRLTRKADELFPSACHPLTISLLQSAAALYGPLAPEKILYHHFEKQISALKSRVKGDDPVARARWLVRLRDAEGCMASVERESPLLIIERHSPLGDILDHYPCTARFEEELYSKVIGVRMSRQANHHNQPGITAFCQHSD